MVAWTSPRMSLLLRRFWLRRWAGEVSSGCPWRALSGVTWPYLWEVLAVPPRSSGQGRLVGTCLALIWASHCHLAAPSCGPDAITRGPHCCHRDTHAPPPSVQPRLLVKGCGLHSWLTAATASLVQLQVATPRCCWLYPISSFRGWGHWDLGETE